MDLRPALREARMAVVAQVELCCGRGASGDFHLPKEPGLPDALTSITRLPCEGTSARGSG